MDSGSKNAHNGHTSTLDVQPFSRFSGGPTSVGLSEKPYLGGDGVVSAEVKSDDRSHLIEAGGRHPGRNTTLSWPVAGRNRVVFPQDLNQALNVEPQHITMIIRKSRDTKPKVSMESQYYS